MREGWNYKRLIEVCDFQGGSQPPKEEWSKEPKPNYVRMLQIRDFTQSATDYIEFVKVSKSLKYCQDDDILLGRYGASVGKVLTGLSGAYNVAIIKAIPNVALVSKKYIKSYFLSPGFQLNLGKVSQHRAAQAGFSKDDIAGFPIPIPPIQEQEKIVAELDCLTGIIEKKTQQLEELDKLARSIFYDMFGDPESSPFPVKTLGELSRTKLSYGSGASAIPYDGRLRYVRITDIVENGTLNNDIVSPSTFDEKYLLHEGDLLFARSGATVGKTYMYRAADGDAIFAGYLIRVVPDTRFVLPNYLFSFTKTGFYRRFIGLNAQAVAQPNINAKQYGSLKVVVPPLDLQNEFAQKIEAIEKQKELVKRSIVETETLFNSRMNYWFN